MPADPTRPIEDPSILDDERLYPLAAPQVPGFDISGTTVAADITGGDYFDFLIFPGGGLGLVIGDVSGHGFDSAILMAETRAV
jgi:serine phosphatase RsbU (regulator of sigma subunit)